MLVVFVLVFAVVYCICPCLCGGVFVFVKIRAPRASLAEAPVDGRMYEPGRPPAAFSSLSFLEEYIHVCAINTNTNTNL